jgi:hypothetical protein
MSATAPSMATHTERGADCYETDPRVVRALLQVETFQGIIWEPACGPGSIVRTLRAAGYRVAASDLFNYDCINATSGVDFLSLRRAPAGVTAVITNPPFMYANEFVRRAQVLVPRVAMLLPLRFLEGRARSDIIDGGRLARVHVFIDRIPMMHRRDWQGNKAGNAHAYAWFIWARDHVGPPEVHRIECKKSSAKHDQH